MRKQSLDSGIGQFINEILPYVCWKRSKFYLKVDKNGTSQECSNCGNQTGKKLLRERRHHCQYCGYTAARDVVSAEVIRNRGLIAMQRGLGGFPHERRHQEAVGHTVKENAYGDFNDLMITMIKLFVRSKDLGNKHESNQSQS